MITLVPFKKNLVRPVTVFKGTTDTREGFYLEWFFEGTLFKAEVSPLDPSLLPEIKEHLETHKDNFEKLLLEALAAAKSPWDFKVPSPFSQVRFAICSLFLEARNLTDITCKIQGFLDMKDSEVLIKIRNLIENNVSICKFKIDPSNIVTSQLLLQKIMSRTNFTFRLDANQSMSLNEAIDFSKDLPHARIEYFEEPLQTPQLLEEFYAETGFKYALDESLNTDSLPADHHGLSAIVVKPSLVGDFTDLTKLLKSKIPPITISSTYETDVGLRHLVLWAQILNPDGSHGLDTFDIFEESSNFQIRDGKIVYV